MRGATLNALIQDLRRELRVAESPALGKNSRESYAYALRSAQARLFEAHDWPFKNITRDIPLLAGQRYYAPPSDMDLENIRSVEASYNGQWFGLTRGIGTEQYNITNSDNDERSDPPCRWETFNDPDNGDMIEFWPIPASDGVATARFKGVRKLGPLISDSDKCDLDGLLLVLTAAADLAPAKDAPRLERKAASHLFALRRNLSNTDTFISGGGEDPRARGRREPRVIVVSG